MIIEIISLLIIFILIIIIFIIILAWVYSTSKGCKNNSDCGEKGVCYLNNGVGTCVKTINGTCSSNSNCIPGLECIDKICTIPKTIINTNANINTNTNAEDKIKIIPIKKTEIKQQPKINLDTEDSEINSIGSNEDVGFEIDSEKSSIDEIQKDYIYCNDNILDVCSISGYVIYLLNDGNININNNIHKNNINLNRIINFKGILLGITKNGQLAVNTSKINNNNYIWKILNQYPNNLIDFNVSLNQDFISLQSIDKIFIYYDLEQKSKIIENRYKRIYLYDELDYIDIDNINHIMYYKNKIYYNCYGAILDHNNHIIINNDSSYKRIKLSDWIIYYLKY